MNTILETKDLVRKFGTKVAVKNANLHIKKGEIYGLIGRNGAGKTTILKMVAGLIRPTSGEISVYGKPIREALTDGTMQQIGTLIENPGIYNNMTGRENLMMKCIVAEVDEPEKEISRLLDLVGLADVGNKRAGGYSLGMKQRLGIALALVGNPEILVLDEPINGLDPQGIMEVREILLKLHDEYNITIMISSHILEELAKMVTTVGIIDEGVLIREFTREEMENECREAVTIKCDAPGLCFQTLEKAGFTEMKVLDARTLVVNADTDRTPEMLETLVKAGVSVRECFITTKTLEQFFMDIVGGAKNV